MAFVVLKKWVFIHEQICITVTIVLQFVGIVVAIIYQHLGSFMEGFFVLTCEGVTKPSEEPLFFI